LIILSEIDDQLPSVTYPFAVPQVNENVDFLQALETSTNPDFAEFWTEFYGWCLFRVKNVVWILGKELRVEVYVDFLSDEARKEAHRIRDWAREALQPQIFSMSNVE